LGKGSGIGVVMLFPREVVMIRFIHGLWLASLVLAFAFGAFGCSGGDTAQGPPKGGGGGGSMMEEKMKEMGKKHGSKGSDEQADKDKAEDKDVAKNKDKAQDKKEKDKAKAGEKDK